MEGVSIVIPCLNEEQYIGECLDGLILNGYNIDLLDVLVVDGGSTDKTREIVSTYQVKYSCIQWIKNKKQKTPFALNLGIKNAKYSYVLIAGAHAVYPLNYIAILYQLIKSDNIDVVGGVLETKSKHENVKSNAICYVLSHPFGVGNSTFRTGADELLEVDTVPFGLYKKELFDIVGLYNEKLIRNHDMELSSRIKSFGYHIWMDPTLKCTYYARETFMGLARNNYGNGYWNLKTLSITRKFSSLGLRHFIPLFFVLSLLIPCLLLFFFSPWILIIAGVSLLSYFSLLVFIYVNSKGQNFFYLMYSFLCLHFSYGWGSIMGALSIYNFRK